MKFTVDENELRGLYSDKRLWQGIPGIEVTKRGRIFASFYSGDVGERMGNYCLLVVSNDGGETFSEPVAAAIPDDGHRCYDPCVWLDPAGRLWYFWAYMPDHAVYAAVCDDPDAKKLVFGEIKKIGHDVMMNKPTVLSDGRWLLPIAVWREGVKVLVETEHSPRGAYAYESRDCGETFMPVGYSSVEGSTYDEHMLLEKNDGTLEMFVRTSYGIGKSVSDDGGATWTEKGDTGLGGPNSRFCIRRLSSGRILLVNHVDFTGRNNLTAMLSEDDGKTFPYRLLLDGRPDVSYPDATETPDGKIYIIYDRERGAVTKKMRIPPELSAKEVLMAVITEEDIMAGKIVTPGCGLARTVSRIGK